MKMLYDSARMKSELESTPNTGKESDFNFTSNGFIPV